MFPGIEYIKTVINGIRLRIETIEKSSNSALAQVKAQVLDVIQDIKNIRIESVETVKSSTADWGQNDSNALDYVKNRTHYMLPATPIDSLEFTATSNNTIAYTLTSAEEEFAMFQYFQSLRDKGEVLKVTVGGKTGLLAVTFDRGNFGFSGVLAGSVMWRTGEVLSLVAQNDFIIFDQGDVYTVSFEDTTKPYYIKLDFNYMPDNVYHSENAPVKFGSGNNSTVQGSLTTASRENAHAEGQSTKASGHCAHAEGDDTVASGEAAHAEGDDTVASGEAAHAEGASTEASGECSHAEGRHTKASGSDAHAEGDVTVANRQCMHVEGAYNLYDDTKYFDVVSSTWTLFLGKYYAAEKYVFDADTGYYTLVDAKLTNIIAVGLYYAGDYQYENGIISQLDKTVALRSGSAYDIERHVSTPGEELRGKYVHVVGNGNSSTRSNAYTLDWEGVPWFQGRPQFGGTAQDDGSQTVMANGDSEIVLKSSGGKKFRITVDDTGTLSATEVTS